MANFGGKVLLFQAISFESGIVSIGDGDTDSAIENSVVIGNNARVLAAATPGISGIVVMGKDAYSSLNTGAVVIGTGAYAVGTGLTLGGSAQCVIIGQGAHSSIALAAQNNDFAVAIGYHAASKNGSSRSVVVGYQCEADGAPGAVVVGTTAMAVTNYAGVGDQASVVIGTEALAEAPNCYYAFGAVAIGYQAEIHGSASDPSGIGSGIYCIAIGTNASAIDAEYSVVIGDHASTLSADTIVIGKDATIADLASDSIAIGQNAEASSGCVDATLLGGNAGSLGLPSARVIVIGPSFCEEGCDDSIVIGAGSQIRFGSSGAIAIGYQVAVTNDNVNAIIIGESSISTLHYPVAPNNIAIGYDTRADGSFIVIGSYSEGSDGGGIILGTNSYVSGVAGNPIATVLGNDTTVEDGIYSVYLGAQNNSYSPGQSFSLMAGFGNTFNDPSPTGSLNCIGAGNVLGDTSDGSLVFGQVNEISFALQSVVLGRNNILTSGSFSIVLGNDNSVSDVVSYSILIGTRLTVTSSESITLGFGATNSVDNTMLVGDNADSDDSVHTFVINGYNGGALVTFSAIDAPPADGQTGITVAYNTGAGVVNRDVYVSAAPPPGAIILYMIP